MEFDLTPKALANFSQAGDPTRAARVGWKCCFNPGVNKHHSLNSEGVRTTRA